MTDVFLSYARQDEAMARRIATALAKAGIAVWWDADLPAHRDYSEVIEARLGEAKAVVVLWSAAAAKSQWVRAEADFARNAGTLVQASLDGGLPPMPFNQIQCAPLKGWRGAAGHPGWAKLRSSVEALVGGERRPVPPPPSRIGSSRRMLLALAAVVLLCLAAGTYWLLRPGEAARPVVAVLPFKSLDPANAGLVAGIWEDTRQAIGRNPQLLVLGPNTAEEIAAGGGERAKKLADYLVEARVRSVGDRVRVSANLVRTDDGLEVWSKNFDRKLDDVFALQTEIAHAIEGHIRGRLAESGGIKPENIATTGDVYALYSNARLTIRKRNLANYAEAREQLERVVKLDPNFAPAWATLAVVRIFEDPDPDNRRISEADARRAIALAPNLAAGHAALGFALQEGPVAEAALRRAIALDPTEFEAMHWLANSLTKPEQVEERLRLYEKVVEIEPLWWPAIYNRLGVLADIGNTRAIEQELKRVQATGNASMAAAVEMMLLSERHDLSAVVRLGLKHFSAGSEAEQSLMAMHLFPALLQLGYTAQADQIFRPPSDYIPFIRTNDPRAMDLIEKRHSPQAFWTFGELGIVGARVYLLNGQGPRLAKIYHDAADSPEAFEALVGPLRMPAIAPGVALALRSAGDDAEAGRLLARAETLAKNPMAERDPIERQVTLARIHAVQGRKDEALAELGAAVRGGWIPPYLPIHVDIALDPPLRELSGDPRFERLRQQIFAYLAKEKAELGPLPERLDVGRSPGMS